MSKDSTRRIIFGLIAILCVLTGFAFIIGFAPYKAKPTASRAAAPLSATPAFGVGMHVEVIQLDKNGRRINKAAESVTPVPMLTTHPGDATKDFVHPTQCHARGHERRITRFPLSPRCSRKQRCTKGVR
jgi:hypothetical protein